MMKLQTHKTVNKISEKKNQNGNTETEVKKTFYLLNQLMAALYDDALHMYT